MTAQNSTPLPSPGPRRAHESDAYHAARSSAALFDRSAEGRLLVRGADRASWLQGLLTNDVLALSVGSGCYAAYLTPQGRMLTDLRILALADAMLLDLPASTAAAIRDRLDLFVITEDVTVEDVTASLARLSVHGPGSAGCVARAVADPALDIQSLADLGEHSSVLLPFGGGNRPPAAGEPSVPLSLLVAGARDLGEPGFDLYLPADQAATLAGRLRAAGAVDGDSRTWEVLRVEAGRPAFGIDMDAETIPLEAGIEDRAISFTKGCYVGQEVIIRVVHRGHGRVARRLVGLVSLDPAGPLDVGPAVAAGDALMNEPDERAIGQIRSAVVSPRMQATIALGYVHRDFAEPGTRVTAVNERGMRAMEVRPLPFR